MMTSMGCHVACLPAGGSRPPLLLWQWVEKTPEGSTEDVIRRAYRSLQLVQYSWQQKLLLHLHISFDFSSPGRLLFWWKVDCILVLCISFDLNLLVTSSVSLIRDNCIIMFFRRHLVVKVYSPVFLELLTSSHGLLQMMVGLPGDGSDVVTWDKCWTLV